MKYIELAKTVPDGRTFNVHAVTKAKLLKETAQVKVTVGSFTAMENLMQSMTTPSFKTEIIFSVPAEEIVSFINEALEQVNALPDWQGTIVDLNAIIAEQDLSRAFVVNTSAEFIATQKMGAIIPHGLDPDYPDEPVHVVRKF